MCQPKDEANHQSSTKGNMPMTKTEPSASASVGLCMEKANDQDTAALIRPFEFTDEVTGDAISVSVSSLYSMITVNRRTYYFHRETGEFDGAATGFLTKGPVAV